MNSTNHNAIEVTKLKKQFGDFVAVKDVSFTVQTGEIFGLLGPNGAGKTTLIRMMTTLTPPTSGTAEVGGHDVVTDADFGEALEKILLGTARGIVLSPEEKLSTAYHESGHALLGMLTPGADPVRRVTIIPRGQALGVTVQTPQMDRYGYSEKYLRGRIAGALGGRAAEEIVYGEVTTGAESDLDQATRLARQMVGRWGMSAAVGPVVGSILMSSGESTEYAKPRSATSSCIEETPKSSSTPSIAGPAASLASSGRLSTIKSKSSKRACTGVNRSR